jgi:phosphoglycolate phosphatase-like HAD superfamily hydrolase
VTIVFWDIDGTLLTTGRAGIFAWEDACRTVTGRQLELQSLRTDGLTDHLIAARILELQGGAADPDAVSRMVDCYESRLPVRLPERQGRVLTGVHGILDYLRARRPDVHSMLLTGNTAAGARAKLEYYGLQEFFDGGAFSRDTAPRTDIASRALAAVRSRFPDAAIEPEHVFVVGDTPHDIDCARAIGARAIAVATGTYGIEALTAHGAWQVLPELPDPPTFATLLEDPIVD